MNLFSPKKVLAKPLHVRKRVAVIATGLIGLILILSLVCLYAHPRPAKHDPERGLMAIYTTVIEKIQSLFLRK
ncbi:MAG TPA: hypothetical protein VL576_01520 [Candidatus Paceibacterota bacterium]|jgi:hypothetical protein|nr:hypothetical protein [Candidatus Paceibacterota bacterium]